MTRPDLFDIPRFDNAACAAEGAPPDMWFPGEGDPAHPARAVCRRCPAIRECLAWALTRNEDHGIWGGTTREQRRALRRRINQQMETPA